MEGGVGRWRCGKVEVGEGGGVGRWRCWKVEVLVDGGVGRWRVLDGGKVLDGGGCWTGEGVGRGKVFAGFW